MKRHHKPRTTEFAFEDSDTEIFAGKKQNWWPLVTALAILIAIVLLAYLIISNQYTPHQMKQLYDDGKF